MQNLQVAVGRPHYVHRNQQPDKTQFPKERKKRQVQAVSFKNMQLGQVRSATIEKQQELKGIKQLKSWLLGLLNQAHANWEQQLASRRNWVMMMRQEHKEKLMRILQYIENLRKKAYQQFKHVCDRTRQENCTDCGRRALFFNQQVRNYLSSDSILSTTKEQENIKNDKNNKRNSKNKSIQGIGSQRSSIQMVKNDQSKRGSKRSDRSNNQLNQSNSIIQEIYVQNEQSKFKKPHSKFKRVNNSGQSNRNSVDKRTSEKMKLMMSQQRDGNQYRFSAIKRQVTNDGKTLSQIHVRNSSQIHNNQEQPNTPKNVENGRGLNDSMSKGDSKTSLRQPVLRHSGRSPFQEGDFHRAQFKIIDAQEAAAMAARAQGRSFARYGKPGGIQRNSGQLSEELLPDRKMMKKKSTKGKKRYIKKNSSGDNGIDIEITSSEEDDGDLLKRQRQEIDQLLREKEYFKDDHYKKVSRYRRERMVYDILKREILLNQNQSIEKIPQIQIEQHKEEPRFSQMSSNIDLTLSRQHDHLTSTHKPKLKKYSIMERKESLISKLALLNQQGNSIESIRCKIQEILNEKCKLNTSGKDDKANINAIQKFLSQVLKITDLKRLMKEKFMKQADWSSKMQQMHQFYTYLEYSMQAFRSKLNKTTQSSWKQLTYQGKSAETQLDGLVLDNQMRDWEGLDLATLGQQHDREIECSMKYYGIDVKRLKNINQINYQVAANKNLNPIFSSVSQRSMKQIQQITEGLFCLP